MAKARFYASDLIQRLRNKGYTEKAASTALHDVTDVIADALAECEPGEHVQIKEFGNYAIKHNKPKSKSPRGHVCAETNTVKFDASSTLKQRINK